MVNHPNRSKLTADVGDGVSTLSQLRDAPHTKRCFVAVGVHVAEDEPLILDCNPGFYAAKSDILVYCDDGGDYHGYWGYSKIGKPR
jgi:hypothetical protein